MSDRTLPRRALLNAAPAVLLMATGLLRPLAAHAAPRYTVPREEIEEAVKQRFPLRYPVSNLATLAVLAPRIGLKPDVNRLNADLPVEASGPVLRRTYNGRLNVDFGLRYEPKDRTLRAHDLQINALEFPDLPPEAALLLSQYGPQLARQSLGEVVLHTLKPEDLALPDGLGLQPGAITVTDRGLAVKLVPKPLF
ncbi:DUF1439 domain-containing protein [Paracidovorax wautersii]|uniref:DUF1439 domain-containing protein n=1 Tax=Paracidovorax wautersii TaxID=1177982 RepID=A0ABU1I9I7_9BURK|nr:DUF1439 domain-containing protein [Paracidovorax wautersii]MDR6213884.1 hypothetical protein [Paracidovorax wautersii]